MVKPSFIYTLSDETGIRYVGQSVNPKLRLTDHIKLAKAGDCTDKANWIRSLLQQGKRPVLNIIEECTQAKVDGREWDWINYYKEQGCNLVNMPPSGGFYFHKKKRQ